MPYITFTTTKTLTLNQEKALKESAGQLISILPNKKEENLMIHIEEQVDEIIFVQVHHKPCYAIQ